MQLERTEKNLHIERYEHGGSRIYFEGADGNRELIADTYQLEDRELIFEAIRSRVRAEQDACSVPWRSIAERLVAIDWCIGYELTDAQYIALDEVRSDAASLLTRQPESAQAIYRDGIRREQENRKEIAALKARAEKAEADAKALRDFAEDVVGWSEAYPERVFPEPSVEQIKAVCDGLGITLDCVSAAILRTFTKPLGDKARDALTRQPESTELVESLRSANRSLAEKLIAAESRAEQAETEAKLAKKRADVFQRALVSLLEQCDKAEADAKALREALRKEHFDYVSFVTDPGIVGDGSEEAIWSEHKRYNPNCPVCTALVQSDKGATS